MTSKPIVGPIKIVAAAEPEAARSPAAPAAVRRDARTPTRGLLATCSLQESIRQSIQSVLTTLPGTLPHFPTYGCELARLRFQPGKEDDRARLGAWVEACFPHCDPRIARVQVMKSDIAVKRTPTVKGAFAFVQLRVEIDAGLVAAGADRFLDLGFECQVYG